MPAITETCCYCGEIGAGFPDRLEKGLVIVEIPRDSTLCEVVAPGTGLAPYLQDMHFCYLSRVNKQIPDGLMKKVIIRH